MKNRHWENAFAKLLSKKYANYANAEFSVKTGRNSGKAFGTYQKMLKYDTVRRCTMKRPAKGGIVFRESLCYNSEERPRMRGESGHIEVIHYERDIYGNQPVRGV